MPEPPALTLMKSQTSSEPAASRPARISISECGAEIGPGEFLFPRPAQGNWRFGGAGQAGRFDRRFARVLSAKAAARIGHDRPATFSAGTFSAEANSPRTPNGFCVPVQTVSLSPSHWATAARGSIGAMLDVGDVVGLVQDVLPSARSA